LRPPAPQTDTLPGCATPRTFVRAKVAIFFSYAKKTLDILTVKLHGSFLTDLIVQVPEKFFSLSLFFFQTLAAV